MIFFPWLHILQEMLLILQALCLGVDLLQQRVSAEGCNKQVRVSRHCEFEVRCPQSHKPTGKSKRHHHALEGLCPLNLLLRMKRFQPTSVLYQTWRFQSTSNLVGKSKPTSKLKPGVETECNGVIIQELQI